MTVVTIVKAIWLIAAACLTILVLLHSPKGDGIGGIGGQAQLFTSTRSAETNLNRITWTLAIVFIGLTIVLSAGWLGRPVTATPATDAPPVVSPAPASASPSSPVPDLQSPAVPSPQP